MNILAAIILALFSFGAMAQDLTTASYVDVSRYVGKWYAHYALPQFFTRKCQGQTAEYEIIDSKTISVLNTCLKNKKDTTIKGQAVITNVKTNSELIVTFNNFFTRLFRVKGDYNIIKLDENYEYVLVGTRDRLSLWLMSRSPLEIPEDVLMIYLNLAKKEGFNTSKLLKSNF